MDNTGDDIFGTDEEFEQRLKEFKDRCRKRCCKFLKRTKNKISRQKFAAIVLLFSFVTFCVGLKFCVLAQSVTSVMTIIYSLVCISCSGFSLWKPRGYTVYSENNPENKRLLSPRNPRNRQSHMSLEDVMEPRQGSGIFEARSPYQVACEVDRSIICEPLNYDDGSPSHCRAKSSPKLIYGENSEGTSSAPDPFPPLSYEEDASVHAFHRSRKAAATNTSAELASDDSFEHITYSFPASQSIEDSNDSEDPIRRQLPQARLSADVINTFGNPVGILGADKFIIFQGSDEHTFESSTSPGSWDVSKVKTFEVSVEVHPNTSRQISSGNDGSSYGEPTSLASDETTLKSIFNNGDSNKQIGFSSGQPVVRDKTALTQVSNNQDEMNGSLDVHKVKSLQVSVEIHSNSSTPINSNNGGSSSSEPASMVSDETAQTSISDYQDIVPGSYDVDKVKTSQVSVEVEVHPYPSKQINSNNDSSSSEFASVASDETAQTPVSDLNEEIPFIDD